jgi:hypothetical protein
MAPDPVHLDELLALMEDTEKEFVGLLPKDDITPSYGKLVAGSLLSDCLALHLAIRTLLKIWLSDEAGVLLRKLMENSVALVYLGGKHDRLEELALEFMHALTRKELALWLADQQAYGDKRAADGLTATRDELQRLKDEWRALGKKGNIPAFPKAEALLKKMGQGDKRRLMVRGHLYAHTSAGGLQGRLNEARQDAIVFDTHTDPNRGVPVGATALELLMGAGLGAAGAFGWSGDTTDAITKLRSDLEPKLTTLLRAARA